MFDIKLDSLLENNPKERNGAVFALESTSN